MRTFFRNSHNSRKRSTFRFWKKVYVLSHSLDLGDLTQVLPETLKSLVIYGKKNLLWWSCLVTNISRCLLSSAMTQDDLIIVLLVAQWSWKLCPSDVRIVGLSLTLLMDVVATAAALSLQVRGTHLNYWPRMWRFLCVHSHVTCSLCVQAKVEMAPLLPLLLPHNH